ncbi:LPS-assembly protein LptD [Steroidobacter sp.]|uniref:LPS-assembly protein LptD n=1 Tax=Steroidobacter sp. TaxID=1978227 RepID=UPI001A47CA7C|nr:LPS-assembly protein LptD [Steroidobacter sp.]MBL8268977.1 LPS-assembly protein LptD [Steroidobacter sp.]
MLAAASLSGTAYAAEPAADPAKTAESTAEASPEQEVQQAPKCPAPNTEAAVAASQRRPPKPVAELPEDIEFESDGVEGIRDGELKLTGKVEIRQGERRIETRDATYNQQDESFSVDQGVEYSDGTVKVRGEGAQIDRKGGAVFEHAEFELPDRNARGSADRIRASTEGTLSLDKVRYTTCPLGNEDWMLTASDIDISQAIGLGIGRGVRLDFKGIPLLYTPFISFPVGNQRKSGFLFPTIGTSSRSGYSLSVPWYWNIAPNYDATFTPTYFSKRGPKLDTEFRYLNPVGKGQLEVQYLPDDREFGAERSLVRFVDQSDFTRRLRLNIDASNASDDEWFEDFGLGPEGTSITYLNRSASLTYLDDRWLAILHAQNFQTIDFATENRLPIAPADRPYTMLPQLAVRANFPDQPFGLSYGMDMELANFQHNVDGLSTGWRSDFSPEIRMPLRGAGVYIEPAASWRYTRYKLHQDGSDLDDRDDTFSRSAPVLSVDGGMVFERLFGSRKQRLSTIEPRFMYLYVPYRNQDDLPVFDTERADLNLVQLFRTNRYVGADRLGDANQLAIGFTSRWLDAHTGEQYIAATVGQAYYFDRPRVTLPGEDVEDPESSDIIAELDLRAYGNWNIRGGIQWDPGETRSERGQIQLQYRPNFDRVMNLGYRFRRDRLEQVDGSVAWPVSRDWSLYARMVYSLEGDAIDNSAPLDPTLPSDTVTRRDEKGVIDQFAGLEYRSCCWRFRVVARRYVSDRTGDLDTSVLFQLELNGLSNVGVGANTFLERSIRGYSVEPPEDK